MATHRKKTGHKKTHKKTTHRRKKTSTSISVKTQLQHVITNLQAIKKHV